MRRALAIHAPSLARAIQITTSNDANRGWYTAIARHGGFEQISFCTAEQPQLSSLQRQFGVTPGAALLSIESLTQTNAAAQAGTLLRGQPYLSDLAWQRGHCHGHQAYSLVGMIHTLARPSCAMIGDVGVAQPDALICTSGGAYCLSLARSLAGAPSQRFGNLLHGPNCRRCHRRRPGGSARAAADHLADFCAVIFARWATY